MFLFLITSTLAEPASPTGGLYGGQYVAANANPIDIGGEVVGRLGVAIVPPFDLEVELGWVEGRTRDLGIIYHILDPRMSALFHINPQQRADVFFSVGAGFQRLTVQRESEGEGPGAQDRALYENPSQDFLVHMGPGMTLQLGGPVHIRADVRYLGSFGDNPTVSNNDTFHNVEWTLGLDFRREIPPDLDGDGYTNKLDGCPEEAEDFDKFEDQDGCPDFDNDKDGIVDDRDECVEDPEDDDDFEDNDGCPEDDNDKDGIMDRRDQCPEKPEDVDGWEDEDGCPDKDNDGDGISDKKDTCPDHPEDLDGWEDEDGCPDKDNDDDRIVDARDACPNEAEVYNGFDDEEGCPDDVPEAIQKFTGVIKGITFETGKAVIRPSSYTVLTEALHVLQQYQDLKLEIQGHTDAVGRDDKNLALSQARAEAVMNWFLMQGIDPSRLRAVGYGETVPIADNDSDAGRAENRRVEFKRID